MHHSVVTAIECVEIPGRQDKPHRRLSLDFEQASDDPSVVVLVCRSGPTPQDETIFRAEVEASVLDTVMEIHHSMSRETRTLKEW